MCVRRSTIHFKRFLKLNFPAHSRTLIYFEAACCWSYCRVKQTLCHVIFYFFLRFAQGVILNACHWPSCWIYMIPRLYLLICSAEASSDVKTAAHFTVCGSLFISVCVCVDYTAHLCDHFTLNWRPSHWTRHVTNYYTESVHVFICVCVLGVVFDGYNNTGCVICSIWVGLPVGFWFIMAGQSGKSIQRSAVGDSSAVTCTDRRQSKWFTTTSFRSCDCIPKERGVISFSHKANL